MRNHLLLVLPLAFGCGETKDTLEAQDATLSDLQGQVSAVQAQLDALQTAAEEHVVAEDLAPYALSSDLDDYALLADLDATDADIAALDAATPELIATSVTLTVAPSGGDFADLPSALDSLGASFIAASAIVTIQVEDGTYNHTEPIELSHPQGANIHILGNTETPASVVLAFSASDGVQVDSWASVAEFNGFRLVGPGQSSGIGNGLSVVNGASLYCGARNGGCALELDSWGKAGAFAQAGGTIVASNLACTNNVHGLWARTGGYIRSWNAVLDANSNNGAVAESGVIDVYNGSATGNVHGYAASNGGLVSAQNADAIGNSQTGFLAISGGLIRADGGISNGNTHGYNGSDGAVLIAPNSSAGNNTNFGYRAAHGAFLGANGTSVSTNGTDYRSADVESTDNSIVRTQ